MKKANLLETDVRMYPLTHPQKRIWYIEKIYPDTSLHNVGGAVRIKGAINFQLLEEAINIFIKDNEGLRLQFAEKNGGVNQYVNEFKKIKLDFFDFSTCKKPENEFNSWIHKEIKRPFLLSEDVLFYFATFKITDKDNGYFVKFHHIIIDGWSVNIMTEQICDIYEQLLKGEKINTKAKYSYIEYIENEQEYLDSKRFIKNKKFWNEKFNTLPEVCLNTSADNIKGNRKTFYLDEEISKRIKEFADKYNYSLNTFFVSTVLIYLFKTIQQSDLVIGTPVLNRSGKRERNTIGMFTSTMPFRFDINDHDSVLETFHKVNSELRKNYFHQKYPYNLLVQDLKLKKNGYDNLFQICVNYYNTNLIKELNGYPINNLEVYNGNQIYSLQVIVREWSNTERLILDFDYKIDDYSESQIRDMYTYLGNLIREILSNPEEKVANLNLLSEQEKSKLLYEFNSTISYYPKDRAIHHLFEEQVVRSPDKIAISFNKEELTYKQLNERSNQLAKFLKNKGVSCEQIVGIMTTHSLETIIGILGILKAGGAFLPIDRNYPLERINFMIKDSGLSILLDNFEVSDELDFNGEIINLSDSRIYFGDTSNLESIKAPGDLAYIIYTSGSTGTPKGVMINHKGLVNYSYWAKERYITNVDEVFPLYSSLAFDLTLTSIFVPLISGNKIVVYDYDETEFILYKIMRENKVNIIKLTPSHLSLLKDMNNTDSAVTKLIVGGEDLKVNVAKSIYKSFKGNIEIYNEYGPTEAVIGCMIHKYDINKDLCGSVPIGVPANNVYIYILDRNLNCVPEDCVGEIYISGDGVGRGYLNRENITKERFIENPFIKGKKMYKTGDLGKRLKNGKIQFLGRVDHQVKVRGHRIELGEIEKYLLKHKNIHNAVTLVRENDNGVKYLCSYIVNSDNTKEKEIKEFLSKFLPKYMVPLHIVTLDKIPLTANGKVNQKLLPEPIANKEKVEYVPVENEIEEKLINAMKKILNIDKVSINDNFYHIGGDSIKAIQISANLDEIGLKIKVQDILSHPIIKDMAIYVSSNSEKKIINQKTCKGTIKHTPITFWFFSRGFINLDYYNQSIMLRLEKNIPKDQLDLALIKLIKHHDILRLNYNKETGEMFYNDIYLTRNTQIHEHDLSNYSETQQNNEMFKIGQKIKSSFSLENNILIKACIFNLGKRGKRMLITAHHLIIDGFSWRIIIEDLTNIIREMQNNEKIVMPKKTHSFQKWAFELERYSKGEVLKEKQYWESIINNNFVFPVDSNCINDSTLKKNKTITLQLTENETKELLYDANKSYNTKPNELLIISLALAVFDFTKKNDIVIETEGHGRAELARELDISRTVGWFTSIYPLNLRKDEGGDLISQIKYLKEQIRSVANNGIGFGVLKYLARDINDKSQRHLRFNYLGDFDDIFNNSFFKLASEDSGPDCSEDNDMTCLIDVNVIVLNKKLGISITYNRNMINDETMTVFSYKYLEWLKTILMHCYNKNSIEFTPSDFETIKLSQEQLDSLWS